MINLSIIVFKHIVVKFVHRIHAFLLVNSPYSNISMYILHTVLYTFSMVLMRRIWRICLTIKSCFCWGSFPLFL